MEPQPRAFQSCAGACPQFARRAPLPRLAPPPAIGRRTGRLLPLRNLAPFGVFNPRRRHGGNAGIATTRGAGRPATNSGLPGSKSFPVSLSRGPYGSEPSRPRSCREDSAPRGRRRAPPRRRPGGSRRPRFRQTLLLGSHFGALLGLRPGGRLRRPRRSAAVAARRGRQPAGSRLHRDRAPALRRACLSGRGHRPARRPDASPGRCPRRRRDRPRGARRGLLPLRPAPAPRGAGLWLDRGGRPAPSHPRGRAARAPRRHPLHGPLRRPLPCPLGAARPVPRRRPYPVRACGTVAPRASAPGGQCRYRPADRAGRQPLRSQPRRGLPPGRTAPDREGRAAGQARGRPHGPPRPCPQPAPGRGGGAPGDDAGGEDGRETRGCGAREECRAHGSAGGGQDRRVRACAEGPRLAGSARRRRAQTRPGDRRRDDRPRRHRRAGAN